MSVPLPQFQATAAPEPSGYFSLTTDIIVAFPGETDEDFETTCNNIRKIGFTKIHVFPFSLRKGTKAEKFGGHIDKKIKEERSRIMTQTAEKIRLDFFRNQIGKKYSVLFETVDKDGYHCGHTANYIPVKVKFSSEMCHKTADVIIKEVSTDDFCIGEAELKKKNAGSLYADTR